ncbi:structural protein [Pseudomonas sp. BN515]|uniref:structural protein n=1 Tax=Pseudomonas sp. BN515 TaxID=2567892 RepID=UPI0024560A1F|nr:structural protein [Pseudomonas sp. BN515]MDH4869832.1 structural protein [Pseudomonas sp. BN515]
MRPNTPRGIRNYNPGNIRHAKGVRWQGQAQIQGDTEFVQFNGSRWGIRAIARILITYQDKRRAGDGSRIDSVREIIQRWAPPFENNTDAYVRQVASALGVGPDDETLDVYHFDTMRALVLAIVFHENGPGPLPGGHWYGESIIADGLALAGIQKGAQHGRLAEMLA